MFAEAISELTHVLYPLTTLLPADICCLKTSKQTGCLLARRISGKVTKVMVKQGAADAGGGGGRGRAGIQQLSDLLLVFPGASFSASEGEDSLTSSTSIHVLEALATGGRGRSRNLEFYSLASSLNLKTYFEILQTVQLEK